MIDLRPVKNEDPELYASLVRELRRQQNNVELIASENFVSMPVLTITAAAPLSTKSKNLPGTEQNSCLTPNT